MIVSSASPGLSDGVQVLALLGVERGVGQQLGESQDAVHRRADLVAHRRQELALGAVAGFGRLFRLPQLVLGPLALGDVAQVGGEQRVSPPGSA